MHAAATKFARASSTAIFYLKAAGHIVNTDNKLHFQDVKSYNPYQRGGFVIKII